MNETTSKYCQTKSLATTDGTVHYFSFSGKERDEGTGYSYFGARYYDAERTTMWLSIDPMADKYPNISPYAYCSWNPVKLVDPDGMIIDSTSLTDQLKTTIHTNQDFANTCDALAQDPENTYTFNTWNKPRIENGRQINGEVSFDGENVFIKYSLPDSRSSPYAN